MTIEYLIQNFLDLKGDFQIQKETADEMSVHANGALPVNILTRHTTEDEETFQWRLANYTAISKPVFDRGFSQLYKILKDSKYTVKINDSLEEYTNELTIDGIKYWDWIYTRLLKEVIVDPNAYLTILPIPTETPDGTTMETNLVIAHSNQLYYQDSSSIIWLSDEKSVVTDIYDKDVLQGNIYYVLTDYEFGKFIQVNSKIDKDYQFELVYDHQLGYIPYIQLGGIWNTDGHYRSFFDSFITFANEAVRQQNDYTAIMAIAGYPVREIKEIKCTNGSCNGGSLSDGGMCRSCDGTGHINISGPFHSIVRPSNTNSNDPIDNTPMLTYHSPDVSILDHSKQAWITYLQYAEQALFIQHSINNPLNQSGVAKLIDREEQYAWLNQISIQLFNVLITQSLYLIDLLRNNNSILDVPVVILPSDFSILNIDSLEEKIRNEQIMNHKIPLCRDWINKNYSADLLMSKMLNFILKTDILYANTEVEKEAKIASALISPITYQYSIQAQGILMQLIEIQGEDILNLELLKLKELVTSNLDLSMIAPPEAPVDTEETVVDEEAV